MGEQPSPAKQESTPSKETRTQVTKEKAVKEVSTTTKKRTTPNSKEPAENRSKDDKRMSSDSSKFEDVDLRDDSEIEADAEDFEFVHQKDAPHSSYNSHADHKHKYEKEKDENAFDGTRDFLARTRYGFEEVKRDEKGTSSRNGAADRPEKYE